MESMTSSSMEQILQEASCKYGNIYELELCGTVFYYRVLTRIEHKTLVELCADDFEFEEQVCYTATVYPTQFDYDTGCKAGIPAMLAFSILAKSGFGSLDDAQEMVAAAKQAMDQFDSQMDVVIMTAFPQYRLEELEIMTKPQHIKIFAMAEWSLRVLRGVQLEVEDENNLPGQGVPKLAPPPGMV